MKPKERHEAYGNICGNAAKSLASFCNLDDGELDQAVLMATMLSARGDMVDDQHICQILAWANKLHTECVALHFVLIGATDVMVKDGKINFAINSTEETMQALVKNRIAKEVKKGRTP